MRLHLTILAILHFITSAGELIVALLILGASAGAAMIPDVSMPWMVTLFGSMAAIFFLILAVPGIALGGGLLMNRPWAWVLGLVLGVLHLFNAPFGTVLGIYTLWALTREESKALLGVRRAGSTA
jgi:hypothetical protein